MIMQVGCDCNAKVMVVQTDCQGATNALSCFQETPLFRLLKSRVLPEWLHICYRRGIQTLICWV